MKNFFSVIIISVFVSTIAFGQSLNIPRPSPTQTIDQGFATSKIWIQYSRPGIKERVIFGDLVPYGKVWRTGANSSTKILFGENVKVNGNEVPAGKYALLTIPDKESWTIILSKDTIAGIDDYIPENDQLRFIVKPVTVPFKLETFTINIQNIKNTTCDIWMTWDNTRVTFEVTADTDTKIMKQIDEVMNKDKRPYGSAANYYLENGKDLNQAYTWINKAVELQPDAYWHMTTKAKIEMKLGKYADAIATSTKAMELATADDDTSYVKQNEKIMAEAKAKL